MGLRGAGSLPWVAALLYGLKAAVVALVLQALVQIGRRALQSAARVLAVASFVALEFARVPFPVVVAAGGGGGRDLRTSRSIDRRSRRQREACARRTDRQGGCRGLALWLIPLLAVAATLGGASLWSRLYLFFTKAALVTFGGAYAVLGYVTQQLVDKLGWVTAEQSVAGLALAETTPGPLVIVLQFMGFMAGWNQPGAVVAARFGAARRAARGLGHVPAVVRVHLSRRAARRAPHARAAHCGALAAITAAVVGMIATLALLLARVVLFPAGWRAAPDWAVADRRCRGVVPARRARWPLGPVRARRPPRAGLFLRRCSRASILCWNTASGFAPSHHLALELAVDHAGRSRTSASQ